jgi:hypothetical protein
MKECTKGYTETPTGNPWILCPYKRCRIQRLEAEMEAHKSICEHRHPFGGEDSESGLKLGKRKREEGKETGEETSGDGKETGAEGKGIGGEVGDIYWENVWNGHFRPFLHSS